MGFIDNIKRAFNNLFGGITNIHYDDSAIIAATQVLPDTMSETCRSQIKSIIDEIHQVYESANCKRFTIGIIGDFTVGKSTFVNAILGEEIVPVSANPSTAIITKIEYNREPKAVVHYNSGKKLEMTYKTFLDFSAFSLEDFRERDRTGTIQRLKDVTDATIYVKSKFLKDNNLCLIDTLGLSSHESDNKRTIASIKDAIALIYICDERGLSSKDIDFISTYLDLERGNLFFCVNRIDLVRKSEREEITKLVGLKLNDILLKKGCDTPFDVKRIFQVSSLYQYFANGFTHHEKWREGIDYQSRSGFVPLMNELSKYVKDNAVGARRMSIVRQLKVSNEQIVAVKKYREDEIQAQINTIQREIQMVSVDIKRLVTRVSYVKSLFETREQTIYHILQGIYTSFSKDVNNHWMCTRNFHLINKVSFGIRDYLCLEKDLFALKVNIFKSMSDGRYSQLVVVSPFVDLTFQYLYDTLMSILGHVTQNISRSIEEFCTMNSLHEIMKRRYDTIVIRSMIEPSTGIFLDVKNAMYRAVAEIAVESTWVKSCNRKKKMFDAAKDEALKAMEMPARIIVENSSREIQSKFKVLFDDAVEQERIKINHLNHLNKENEKRIVNLKKNLNDEKVFYQKVIGVIAGMLIDGVRG